MKVSTTVTESTIEIEIEPTDGTDKLIVPLVQGCVAAKVEVNGVIRFTIERPKRPLRYEAPDEKAPITSTSRD